MQEINHHTIEALLMHISKADYLNLVHDFIEETYSHLSLISEEVYDNDDAVVIRAVHSIKGNAISLGFDHLSQESTILEDQLKSHRITDKSSTFAKYNAYVKNFLITLPNSLP
jgi:HPt (histidine-containing phosphotransfer) domain-containing protein